MCNLQAEHIIALPVFHITFPEESGRIRTDNNLVLGIKFEAIADRLGCYVFDVPRGSACRQKS